MVGLADGEVISMICTGTRRCFGSDNLSLCTLSRSYCLLCWKCSVLVEIHIASHPTLECSDISFRRGISFTLSLLKAVQAFINLLCHLNVKKAPESALLEPAESDRDIYLAGLPSSPEWQMPLPSDVMPSASHTLAADHS